MVAFLPARVNWEQITSKEENQYPVNYKGWSSTARSMREVLRITTKRSLRDSWAMPHSMQQSLSSPLPLLKSSQKEGTWDHGQSCQGVSGSSWSQRVSGHALGQGHLGTSSGECDPRRQFPPPPKRQKFRCVCEISHIFNVGSNLCNTVSIKQHTSAARRDSLVSIFNLCPGGERGWLWILRSWIHIPPLALVGQLLITPYVHFLICKVGFVTVLPHKSSCRTELNSMKYGRKSLAQWMAHRRCFSGLTMIVVA